MTVTEHLREHFLMSRNVTPAEPLKLPSLRESEWSPDFVRLMRNRLIQGAYRYGKIHDPAKPQYDRIKSAIQRLKEYEKTGNTEHLVDAANLCLVEFEKSERPEKHFNSTDDGQHVKIRN